MENIILAGIIFVAIALGLVVGAFIGAHLFYKKLINKAISAYYQKNILEVECQDKVIEMNINAIEYKEK